MSKHTPAPWKVVQDENYPSFKRVDGLSFPLSVVMTASNLTAEDYIKRNADLHLIAAAPELLEVAKLAIEMDSPEDATALFNMATKAIAKAKGK